MSNRQLLRTLKALVAALPPYASDYWDFYLTSAEADFMRAAPGLIEQLTVPVPGIG